MRFELVNLEYLPNIRLQEAPFGIEFWIDMAVILNRAVFITVKTYVGTASVEVADSAFLNSKR